MAVLSVVEWPAKVLETPAKPVEVFDEKLKQFVADMYETMDSAGGIGLAANQVDSLQRVIVMNIPWHAPEEGEEPEEKRPWHDKNFTLINPKITKKDGKTKYLEGCLSFPQQYDYVQRAKTIEVSYQDDAGNEHTLEADGLFAICIQHEIDHIDGIVFISRMSRLKAGMIKKKMMQKAESRRIEPLTK